MAENETAPAAEQKDNVEMRPRYWGEIDEKEKCERLRIVVKNLQETVERLSREVTDLSRHEHGRHGLVIPIYYGPMAMTCEPPRRKQSDDEVWF